MSARIQHHHLPAEGTLAITPVLILDLQATSARADNGILWEAGWAWYRGAEPPCAARVSVRGLTLSPGRSLPPAVLKVAGVSPEELTAGISEAELWKELEEAALNPPVPAVIHFARYESGYLRRLHGLYSSDRPFPFHLICTHELARRLLPDLPRYGLRAVAGFLGHSVPEPRRAHHHVVATAAIWHHLVRRLAEVGIEDPRTLMEWLAEEVPATRPAPRIPLPRPEPPLPPRAGVYAMFRSNGDLLYIGKASRLDRRLPSYYRRRGHAGHTLEMLTQARTVTMRVTFSALEAALLECQLIQTLGPPYNRVLRGSTAEIAYYSRDLQQAAARHDSTHPVGPLTDCGPPAVLAALIRVLSRNGLTGTPELQRADLDPAELGSMLPSFVVTGLCPEIWQEVLDRVTRLSGIQKGMSAETVAVRLLRWGRRTSGPNGLQDNSGPEDCEVARPGDSPNPRPAGDQSAVEVEIGKRTAAEDPAEPPPADRLYRWLASVCAYSARLVCRARWYRRMWLAAVRWRRCEGPWNLVMTEGGRPAFAGSQGSGEPIPHLPRALAAAWAERLDRNACVRLRVLATELRRLSAEGAQIELGLPGNRLLSGRRLEVWLKWL
jgi:hypothetical protein